MWLILPPHGALLSTWGYTIRYNTNLVGSRSLSQKLHDTTTIGNMASGKEIKLQACELCNDPDATSFIIPIDRQQLLHHADSDKDEKDVLSICSEDEGLDVYSTVTFSQKITLTQMPNETLTVTVMLKWDKDNRLINGFNAVHHSYDLQLNFHNNLHEISEDYVYIVELNVLKVDYAEVHKYHINLFSHKRIRKENVISIIDGPLNISRENLLASENFCLKIKRFNKATNIAKQHSFSNNIGMILLKSGNNYSDVSLNIGEKIFRAHQLILSSKSDIFKEMFAKEKDKGNISLKIDDVEVRVIEEMLNYIYTGKAENLAELS